MNIVCLDLEGVLVPEIWIAFAEKTGINELKRTTRDEPDYDKLMNYRLKILNEKKLKLQDIQDVISTLDPLTGAQELVYWLKSKTRLVILSDTFSEFATPLMKKLSFPTLFCHDLVIDDNGMIKNYNLRTKDHKRKAIEAFKALSFNTFAAGDSYNDLSMIKAADHKALFCPPKSLTEEFPNLDVSWSHSELKEYISNIL